MPDARILRREDNIPTKIVRSRQQMKLSSFIYVYKIFQLIYD